jgi:ABC-type phosphate/phosphonate transport system ATPase subunit
MFTIEIVGDDGVGKTTFLNRVGTVKNVGNVETTIATIDGVEIEMFSTTLPTSKKRDAIIYLLNERVSSLEHVLRLALKSNVAYTFVRNWPHVRSPVDKILMGEYHRIDVASAPASRLYSLISRIAKIPCRLEFLAARTCRKHCDYSVLPEKIRDYIKLC